MQVADAHDELHGVELDNFFLEALLLEEHFVEFGSAHKRHHKVDAKVVLESVIHADDKRMV